MIVFDKFLSLFKRQDSNGTFQPLDPDIVKEFNEQRHGGGQDLICYAPLKSMRFGPHGKVAACCNNTKEAYGDYPQQSIKEIWNSQQAQILRDHVCHNDLSYGCHVCKLDFEARNFQAVRTYLFDPHPVHDEYPTMMDFQLDNTCNLECVMCTGLFSSSIRKNRQGLPKIASPYNENFSEQLKEFIPHLSDARFTGGEPFLIKQYYVIWDMLSALNPECSVTIQTNGTVLNEKVKNTLQRGRFRISVSIESIEEENYRAIMKNGNLGPTLKNLKWFSNYCREKDTFFGITICPMRQNWRELPALVRFCNDMNAVLWLSVVFAPLDCALWAMRSEDLKEVYDVLSKTELPKNNQLEEQNRLYFLDLLKSIEEWHKAAIVREQNLTEEGQSVEDFKQKLMERFQQFLENSSLSSEQEKEQRIKAFDSKLTNVISRLSGEKLPANCWSMIHEIFGNDLIMEIYEDETEDRLYEDIKVFLPREQPVL